MPKRLLPLLILLLGVGAIALLHAQKPWAQYPGQTPYPVPPDYEVPHEWTWSRLMYDSGGGGFGGGGFGGGGFRRGGRRRGGFGGWERWATDYPKGDRIVIEALKRLTRLDIRSVEQAVALDGSDDIYNWPFLYAVEVGGWYLSDEQAVQLREYIDRGGFFMVDDFHGEDEWEGFMQSFELVFPDSRVVDVPADDPSSTVMFDLGERQQVPGAQYMRSHSLSERVDGSPGHWRGVYNDEHQLVVAIVHNSDLGDAIEYADDPYYPEQFSQQAFRILANYIVYDLTH